MIELNSFYQGNCLPHQCDGCQYGPWVTLGIENGLEYGYCNLWNVEQFRPGTPKNRTGGNCKNKKQHRKVSTGKAGKNHFWNVVNNKTLKSGL